MTLTEDKVNAMKRIKEELREINKNPIANIGVTVRLVNDDNVFEWRCTLMGPKDTSYRNGIFFLNIKFPDNYPKSAPEVAFKTPIYHINVNPNKLDMKGAEALGHVCISTLNWWNPECTVKQILTDIFALFYMANPDSPYGMDRANEFRFNKALHEEKIKKFTKKYANPIAANKEYTESWDFSM